MQRRRGSWVVLAVLLTAVIALRSVDVVRPAALLRVTDDTFAWKPPPRSQP